MKKTFLYILAFVLLSVSVIASPPLFSTYFYYGSGVAGDGGNYNNLVELEGKYLNITTESVRFQFISGSGASNYQYYKCSICAGTQFTGSWTCGGTSRPIYWNSSRQPAFSSNNETKMTDIVSIPINSSSNYILACNELVSGAFPGYSKTGGRGTGNISTARGCSTSDADDDGATGTYGVDATTFSSCAGQSSTGTFMEHILYAYDASSSGAPATYMNIYAIDNLTGNTIANFSATINGTTFSTTNGTIVTNIGKTPQSYNVSITLWSNFGVSYYPNFYATYNSTNDLSAGLMPMIYVGSLNYSGYFTAGTQNITRTLLYSVNMSCPSNESAYFNRYINGTYNGSYPVSCINSSVISSGSYKATTEGDYAINFRFNSTYYTSATTTNLTNSYTYVSDLNPPVISRLDFNSSGSGFNPPSVSTYFNCTDSITPTLFYREVLNSAVVMNGNQSRNTLLINSTSANNGDNILYGNCSDYFDSTFQTATGSIYTANIYVIDERDNILFDVSNITRVRLYVDDNSSYFDFKGAGVAYVNYTTQNMTKLRLDLGYLSGTTITRYADISLINGTLRLCANKEGTTYYEQDILSSGVNPVAVRNIYSNCYIALDYTRFAFEGSYILKAFSISSYYELYVFSNGQQVFLASLDGSIQDYINIDQIAFQQKKYTESVTSSGLSAQILSNSTAIINYQNVHNDNTAGVLSILSLNTGATLYSTTVLTPNNFTLYWYFGALPIDNSTTFRAWLNTTGPAGLTQSTVDFSTVATTKGLLNSGVACFISLILMIAGLSMASSRLTFSFFGIFVILGALFILSLASPVWYVSLFRWLEIIELIYVIIIMGKVNYPTVA